MIASIRNIRKMAEGIGNRTRLVAACAIHPWNRFSADKGDYWDAKDSTILTCPECGESLILARFHEEMEEA